MGYRVEKISKEQWTGLSEYAHRICFNEVMNASDDRIDYALLVIDDKTEDTICYVTVREHDHESVYWQYGGSFDKGSFKSFHGYMAMVKWTLERYTRISTYIENKNTVMLKFAMAVGYLITGVRTYKGSVLLEHLLEKES